MPAAMHGPFGILFQSNVDGLFDTVIADDPWRFCGKWNWAVVNEPK